MEQRCWYPVTHHMHRMNDIQCVIEEGKPLRNAYVHSKCSHAPSDVKPDTDRARRLHCQYLINGKVNTSTNVSCPTNLLCALKVKAIFTVIEGLLLFAVDET